jgi:putative copper resistance protein D
MAIDVPLVLARWVHFVSLMTVFGASLFPLSTLRTGASGASLRALAVTDRVIRLGAYLAFVSALGWIASSLVTMLGDFGSIFDRDALEAFFLETSFGPIWILRLARLLGLVLAIPVGRPTKPRRIVLVCLSGAALASEALLGHAAMSTGIQLVAELTAYVTHVLAAGAWIGGLLPLGRLLAARGSTPDNAWMKQCLVALRSFSNLGIVLVSLILASGIANSAFRLNSAHDLFATRYGCAILGKVLLFSLMLIAAAVNRWRLMPGIENGEEREEMVLALRRNILFEQAAAALVLGLAAILGTLPPRA